MSAGHNVTRVLARNTVWNYAGFVVNLATNLIAFPFVVARLGDAAAGIWLLLGTVTGYMGLLELGLVPSLAQFVAAAHGRGDDRDVGRAAITSLLILTGLAVVPVGLSFAAPSIVPLLHVDADLAGTGAMALRIALLGFAARMPLAVLQALLLGAQRQDRASQLWILMGWAKFGAAFAVLSTGGGLVALVAAETLVHLAGGVLQWRWVRAEMPALRWAPSAADRETAWHLVSYGASLLLLNITTLIIEQTDRLVIAAYLPIAQVTMYSAAWKLYMLAYAVPTTLVQAVGPMTASMHGRGDTEAIRRLFLRMAKYCVAVALPLVATIAASREWLLTIWMGERFTAAGPAVLVLLGTFYITAHNHAAYSVLSGKRRLGPVIYVWSGPQAILNLALSVFLVSRLGIIGVALGTLLPTIVLEPFFARFALREIGVSAGEFFRRVVVPTSGLAALAFSPLAVVALVTEPASVVRFVAAACCSVAYAGLFWLRGLSDEERAAVPGLLPFGLGTSRQGVR